MLPYLTSPFRYARYYNGPLKACILDWSGTLADKYVIAPAIVFKKVFEKHNVAITMEEARIPMGSRKDLHIKEITEMESVKKKWYNIHEKEITQTDIDIMYNDFIPMQKNCIKEYATLLPNTLTTVNKLKSYYRLKIGVSTGFTQEIADILENEAYIQGLKLDSNVGGNIVYNGNRPSPHMLYKNMDNMNITSIHSVLKVDDTTSGIGEGLNAGCWTVGVSRYSNYMNINSLEEEDTLSDKDIIKKNLYSREKLINAGAHYVIDDLSGLPKVIEDINQKLLNNIKP